MLRRMAPCLSAFEPIPITLTEIVEGTDIATGRAMSAIAVLPLSTMNGQLYGRNHPRILGNFFVALGPLQPVRGLRVVAKVEQLDPSQSMV
jgi:hypothetical protein